MKTLHVKPLAPEKELFELSPTQKDSISTSRSQAKKGEYKTHKTVVAIFKKWLKSK